MGRRHVQEYYNDDRTKKIKVIDPVSGSMECEWCGRHVQATDGQVERRHCKDAATKHFRSGCGNKKRRTVVEDLKGSEIVVAAPALPTLTFRKDAAWVVQCHDFVPAGLLASAADHLGHRMKSRWKKLDRHVPPSPSLTTITTTITLIIPTLLH